MLHNSHVSPKQMKSYIYHDNRAFLSRGECELNHTRDLVHPIHLVSCPSHSYDTMQIPGLLSPSLLSTQRCCDVESTPMTLIQRRSNVLCSVGILHQKNQFTNHPAITSRWHNAGLLLLYSLRCWPNISPSSGHRLELSGQTQNVSDCRTDVIARYIYWKKKILAPA